LARFPLADGPINPIETDLFDRRMYGVQIPWAELSARLRLAGTSNPWGNDQ
jgi:hypothetical protein